MPGNARKVQQCSLHLMPRHLCINVAELVANCAHSVPDPHRGRVDTKINQIIECGVSGRREVEDGVRAGNSILAVLQVLVLPNPPRAIDLSVMKEEVGITWRSVQITARVTSNPKVTTSVHAKVSGWEVALHSVLEAENIGAIGDKLVCND
jgi:hypothetical protein